MNKNNKLTTKRPTNKRLTNKKSTNKKTQYIRRTNKYRGGNEQNKEIPDNLGDNVQKVATKLNESITNLSQVLTTKEGVDYFFKLLEKNIDNNGNHVKNNLNYLNNSLIDNSINIIKFITCQIKHHVKTVLEQMEQGKGTINKNMNKYTTQLNDKIEEYSNNLISTINTSKKYVDNIENNLPKVTNSQNGNKKRKTIKKIHY